MICAVVEIETPELGHRSYVVHDGEHALVVDPPRDIERIESVAAAVDVRITHVAETHLHEDYVSGGLQLARGTGAAYLVAAAEPVQFERVAVCDGDEIAVGALTVTVFATPGHTPSHVAYVVGAGGVPRVACTGGSLLHGTVGRVAAARRDEAEQLARAQWHSVRRLASVLPDELAVLPTHGFGSCWRSALRSAATGRTLGDERVGNPALRGDDEQAFVRQLLEPLDGHPRADGRLAALNAMGGAPLDPVPLRPLGGAELAALHGSGTWIVDVRDRAAFARDHLEGSVSFELGDGFVSHLGSVVPWGAPVALLAGSPDRLERARRDLARIGIDRLVGGASGPLDRVAGPLARSSYAVSDFGGLAKAQLERSPALLDVRREEEWRAGHLEGATHVCVADLPGRIRDVPAGEVWVYCASGYRAAVGASILRRAGRDVVLVNDEWANAGRARLVVVAGR